MDEQMLDGNNAAAGVLGEIFSFEVTTAEYTCEGCGRTSRLRGAMAYEVRDLGIIIRYPDCDNSLIRLAQNRGRYMVDLRGMRHLQVEEEVAG
jgi:hypothetical protein